MTLTYTLVKDRTGALVMKRPGDEVPVMYEEAAELGMSEGR